MTLNAHSDKRVYQPLVLTIISCHLLHLLLQISSALLTLVQPGHETVDIQQGALVVDDVGLGRISLAGTVPSAWLI